MRCSQRASRSAPSCRSTRSCTGSWRSAAELTGARYAALGVIDASGSELEQFITHGVDAETHAEIGSLPRGRGILGVLIREAKPLRLHDLAEDPRSVGFPPAHPPMRSFLGVPILLRGRRLRQPLPHGEGGRGGLHAGGRGARHAARRPGRGGDRERSPLRGVDPLVAAARSRWTRSGTRSPPRPISSACWTSSCAACASWSERASWRSRCRAARTSCVSPAAAGEGAEELLGETISRSGSKSGTVFARRRSERIDSVIDDPEVRPGGDKAARRSHRHVGAADRARPGDRRARDPRQGRPGRALLRRRSATGRDVRGPRRGRRRALAARRERCAPSGRAGAGAGARGGSRASSTTRPGRR